MTARPDAITRLWVKGDIDSDPEVAAILVAAGRRYAEDVHLAGLDGAVGSMDYSKPIVDGGGGGDAFGVTRLARMKRVADMRAKLGERYRIVVDAVCIDDDADLTALGRRVGRYAKRETARAIARDRLAGGLTVLAAHYGLR